jgi:hypothetical protein
MRPDLGRVNLGVKGANEMSVRVEHRLDGEHRPRLTILPTTRLGWWAIGLGAAFLPLVFAASVVPSGAAIGFLCGLAGGVAGVIAIVRDRERAVALLLALVPLVIAVAFLLVELISGTS